MRGVPMSRPAQSGTRAYMTDEEFANRAKQRDNARDIDNARTGTFRNEEGTRDVQLHVDGHRAGRRPRAGDHRGARARRRPGDQGSFGVGPWEKVQDFSLYDRCITRGVIGSFDAGRLRQRRAHHPDARLRSSSLTRWCTTRA